MFFTEAVDVLGIALIIAVGFLVYYSLRIMRLLKGGEGWKYLTIGYFLYVPRVFLSFFEDYESARFIISVLIIFFVLFGMWKQQLDLRRVGLSLINLMYARYLLAGLALFLICLSIRTTSYFVTSLNTPHYWALIRLFLLISLIMLTLSSRKISLKWIREDLRVLTVYSLITDRILTNILPITGGVDICRSALNRCADIHEIFRFCRVTENGLVIEPVIKYLDKVNEKEGLILLYDAFSCFNSRLIDMYSAATTAETAVETVRQTEEFIYTLSKTHVSFDNELVYRHRILCGLPHGIAENGKARTFIYILFKKVFEPLLMKCKATTLSGINESDIAKEFDISDGTIGLESLFKKIDEVPPTEAGIIVASTFKRAMDSIYPLIKKDLGEKYVNKWFEDHFFSLFKRPSDVLFKYDILKAIPEDIMIPDKYTLFKDGHSYLIKESDPDRFFKVLVELDRLGLYAPVLTRTQPDQLREKYSLDCPMIWMTNLPGNDRVNPTDIIKLTVTITNFLNKDIDGIMFLDGFEYLVNQNGFDVALRFIESIKDYVALSRFRLLVPVDVRTLSETQFHSLQRELEPVEADVIRKAFA